MDIARPDPFVGADERGQDIVRRLEIALFLIPPQFVVTETYLTDLHSFDPPRFPRSPCLIHRVFWRVELYHFPIDGANTPRDVIKAGQFALMIEVDHQLAPRTVDRQPADDRLKTHGHVDHPVVLDPTLRSRCCYVKPAYSEHLRLLWKKLVSPKLGAGELVLRYRRGAFVRETRIRASATARNEADGLRFCVWVEPGGRWETCLDVVPVTDSDREIASITYHDCRKGKYK